MAYTNRGEKKPSFSFPDRWNRPDVRGLLYAAQGRVCAFSGLELTAGDRGDVEHYRPKGNVAEDDDHWGYWWLAYDASNYVLANRTCNSSRKRDHFPLADESKRVTFETRHSIAEEVPLILNPRVDTEAESWFEIELPTGQPPKFVVQTAAGQAARDRAAAHMKRFRWNTWTALRKARQKAVEAFLQALDENPPRLENAMRMASRYAPHSLAIKLLIPKVRVPGLRLPTTTEELAWWVSELIEEARTAYQSLTDLEGPDGDADERKRVKGELQESMWALACLLRAPPDGKTATVKGPLQDAGLHEFVEELLTKHGL